MTGGKATPMTDEEASRQRYRQLSQSSGGMDALGFSLGDAPEPPFHIRDNADDCRVSDKEYTDLAEARRVCAGLGYVFGCPSRFGVFDARGVRANERTEA